MNYDTLMTEARKTNARRDKIDRANGFAPPCDCSMTVLIETVMGAIEAGITTDDWHPVAEGQAMLEVLLKRLQG